jgi:hypothetical protein
MLPTNIQRAGFMNWASFLMGCLVALAGALPATAQTAVKSDTTPNGFADTAAIGFSLGTVFVPGEHFRLTLIGFHITQLKSGSVGSEFAVYVSPFALSHGALAFAPQWSMMSAKAYGNSWILAKIGVDAVMAFGPGPPWMIPGAHVGVGVLLPTPPRTAVRLELEPHWIFGVPQAALPIMLLSIGISSLPQARK